MYLKGTGAELRTRSILSLIAFLVVTFFGFRSVRDLQPPRSVSETASSTQFSSGRAMKHLQIIAQRPHPIGSVESENVRQYLFKELAALGLNPEFQKAAVVSHWGKQGGFTLVPAASVVNVLARLRGKENTKALMLVAHYD